jgi:DNA polymerase III epsilon subunit-like protein
MTKSKKVCFIYTDTNGLHTINEEICKKNLYGFARLVCLNYEIGYKDNNKYVSVKKVKKIIKPRCMYITPESIKIHKITNEIAQKEGSEIENVLETFLEDIKEVSIIVGHNCKFHLNTIFNELIRYNKLFNLSNYIIIDTNSFYHEMQYPKLEDIFIKYCKTSKKSNIDMLRYTFFKLYEEYEKSILI